MKANAILLNAQDNVVTVVEGAKKGEEVRYFSDNVLKTILASQDIPPCHKLAITPIPKGAHVIKYGESIGGATQDISLGEHVSHLNIESLPRDYSSELN